MALHECELRAVHIDGVDNRLPDLCSRWDLGPKYALEFYRLTGHVQMCEEFVSDHLFLFDHKW